MPFTVQSLGSSATSTGASGTTLTLSPSVAIPANASIVVWATQGDNTTFGAGSSVTDSVGNPYTSFANILLGGDVGVGFSQIFVSNSIIGWSTSTTLTVTRQNANAAFIVNACAIYPARGSDSGVTATAMALSTTPSVTGATASIVGDMNIGVMSWQDTNVATATQPGGWTSLSNLKNPSATTRSMGAMMAYRENSGTSGLTYAPSLTASNRWAAGIVAFRPLGAFSFNLAMMGM